MGVENKRGFKRSVPIRRLEGLVQGAVESDMEKKASAEAFLRRDPALTQKPIFLFRKNDTKTYHFLFPLALNIRSLTVLLYTACFLGCRIYAVIKLMVLKWYSVIRSFLF